VRRRGELIGVQAVRIERRHANELDRMFLEDVHVRALGPVALVGYGWTATRLLAQFHREVELANCEVIAVDGRDAGYVSIDDRGSCWYIDAFAIAPNFQRKGVGSQALRGVLDEAGPMPVRLSVLKVNRARSLYTRIGFRVIGGDARRELMEWRAAA
jgi:ribosomal protein S18 acetylase RimI-like enzyme